MKKYYVIGAFVAALSMFAACNKENSVIENPSGPVSIVATYEQPEMDTDTKVAISEGATNFVLNWEGGETMLLANSGANTNYNDDFTATSVSGTTATFTGGDYPSGVSGTTNYMAVVSSFASATNTRVRGAIREEQPFSGTASIAQNALLVAREDGCTVGALSTLSFKTMNAFLKFSLKKGDTAGGSSNDYSAGMIVTSIVVEAIGEEAISGRFGFSKTDDSWDSAYDEEVDGKTSKIVTLDCTNGGAINGIALDAGTAKAFNVAIAFKTYSLGLKITIYVKNPSGKTGKMVGYISKNTPITITRNKMIRMPELAVSPEDYTPEIVCWSESWSGGEANQTPLDYLASAGHSTVVYNNQAITYTQSSANTKLYTGSMSAGGTEPELLLAKKANSSDPAQTWTITGIPTAGATTLSLVYKSNKTPSVTSPTEGVTITGSPKNYTISTGGASTITLVFNNTTTSNLRLDDIVLKVAD